MKTLNSIIKEYSFRIVMLCIPIIVIIFIIIFCNVKYKIYEKKHQEHQKLINEYLTLTRYYNDLCNNDIDELAINNEKLKQQIDIVKSDISIENKTIKRLQEHIGESE